MHLLVASRAPRDAASRIMERGASPPILLRSTPMESGTLSTDLLMTGIEPLDRLLGGGLLRRATAMLIGPPGSGKTILAQQLAFAAARRGETVLYFTGYSDTH